MTKVSIIGGGVIGLCSAYYLAQEGHEVVVFDKGDFTEGCSYKNAGMIVPSHFTPLAQPGMISKGIKWMFNSKSPFYIHPRLKKDLIKWCYLFYRNSNADHTQKSIPALLGLSLLSKQLFQELNENGGDFLLKEKGILMMYQTERVKKETIEEATLAKKLGLELDILSKEGLKELEPNAGMDVLGAVHYKCDAHLDPEMFMNFLKAELVKMNVVFKPKHEIQHFVVSNNRIVALVTDRGVYDTQMVVAAAGAWSPFLLRKLGIELNILPGKGYSFTVNEMKVRMSIPAILCEGKVAVSPLAGGVVRFGGTMEITQCKDKEVNINRIHGIVNCINSFYPEAAIPVPDERSIWQGLRPCTANGLPYISKSTKIANLILATGHSMMGLSLAPATGKLVADMVSLRPLPEFSEAFSS